MGDKKKLRIRAVRAEYGGSGWAIKGLMSDRMNCVEFVLKGDVFQPIMTHNNRTLDTMVLGYEPWIQFGPQEFSDVIGEVFKQMADLWNEKHAEDPDAVHVGRINIRHPASINQVARKKLLDAFMDEYVWAKDNFNQNLNKLNSVFAMVAEDLAHDWYKRCVEESSKEKKIANLIREVNELKDAAQIICTQVDAYADLINNEVVEHVKLDDLRIAIASIEEVLSGLTVGDAVGKETKTTE